MREASSGCSQFAGCRSAAGSNHRGRALLEPAHAGRDERRQGGLRLGERRGQLCDRHPCDGRQIHVRRPGALR
eukprot:14550612-Alexandrium_andersonii.AAC.1